MIVTARWVRGAMDAAIPGVTARFREGSGSAARRRSAAYGEIVWSWRRDPGVYPCRPVPAGQRGQERPFPGESTYKP